MAIEYLGLNSVNGPFVVLEGVKGAAYDEIVEIVADGKEKKLGRIVEINEDKAVVQVFEGSPAEEVGLQPDDILYKVKGEEVTGQDLSLVVTDLKGEEGTAVDISVMRGTEEIDLTVTRRKIEVPTVESRMLTDTIGYIGITEFDDVTDDQFLSALDELKEEGMQDLVIDLRNNGGGLVDVTCNILDELLPEGLIVYTEDKYGNRQEEYSDAEHYFDGKMAVLVNGNSASASEIFAGAIKDYGVGTLI